MDKQRISEISPLLSVEHIALDVAFADSRHVGLGVTVDRLKLDWTPAAHLSATRLVVGLAESVLLFPPMPAPPAPYVVPAVKSGPPFVLSVNGQVHYDLTQHTC